MDSDDEIDDREAPDPSDMDDDDASVDTVECPNCGRAVYEHAGVCPDCGTSIDGAHARVSPWIVAMVIVVAIAVVAVALFR